MLFKKYLDKFYIYVIHDIWCAHKFSSSLPFSQYHNPKIYMLNPRSPFFSSVGSLRLEMLFCGFQFSFGKKQNFLLSKKCHAKLRGAMF